MTCNDDKNSSDVDAAVENVTSANDIIFQSYQQAKASGAVQIEDIVVRYDNYKAELTVSYWWGNDGALLYGYSMQYRVTSNGRTSGDLTFGVSGDSGQVWKRLLTQNAIQDGEWHDIANGGWVGSPLKTGSLYFKYIFDRGNTWDPAAEAWLKVDYKNTLAEKEIP